MRNIILTSAGFENKVIENKFISMTGKPANEIKALWIPTAAIDDEARAVLPKCMNDLLNAGVAKENITVFDLDRKMSISELTEYDAVYICGGDCRHLLDRMHETGFCNLMEPYLAQGGVYVGVSAGSCICSKYFEDGLHWVPCILDVHCKEGTVKGMINMDCMEAIKLTNQQALILQDEKAYVLE